MLPISEINVGDHFQNAFIYPNGLIYIVVNIDKKERMVKIQAVDVKGNEVHKPFWKKNTATMFSERLRTFNMKEFLAKEEKVRGEE